MNNQNTASGGAVSINTQLLSIGPEVCLKTSSPVPLLSPKSRNSSRRHFGRDHQINRLHTRPNSRVDEETLEDVRPNVCADVDNVTSARPSNVIDVDNVVGTRPSLIIDVDSVVGARPRVVIDVETASIELPTLTSVLSSAPVKSERGLGQHSISTSNNLVEKSIVLKIDDDSVADLATIPRRLVRQNSLSYNKKRVQRRSFSGRDLAVSCGDNARIMARIRFNITDTGTA